MFKEDLGSTSHLARGNKESEVTTATTPDSESPGWIK